ncbi:hypothetical protein OFN56_43065, partial [Escherichia coli]|nr:hypothetical protein [Escherichia coli]
MVQPDVNQPQQPQYEAPLNHATSNVTQRAEPVSQKWEEVTQAFVPSAQPTLPETKAKEAQQGFVSN